VSGLSFESIKHRYVLARAIVDGEIESGEDPRADFALFHFIREDVPALLAEIQRLNEARTADAEQIQGQAHSLSRMRRGDEQ
jgi:hypothetical protein